MNWSRTMKYLNSAKSFNFTEAKLPTIQIDLDVVVLLCVLQLELLWNLLSIQGTAFIMCFTAVVLLHWN